MAGDPLQQAATFRRACWCLLLLVHIGPLACFSTSPARVVYAHEEVLGQWVPLQDHADPLELKQPINRPGKQHRAARLLCCAVIASLVLATALRRFAKKPPINAMDESAEANDPNSPPPEDPGISSVEEEASNDAIDEDEVDRPGSLEPIPPPSSPINTVTEPENDGKEQMSEVARQLLGHSKHLISESKTLRAKADKLHEKMTAVTGMVTRLKAAKTFIKDGIHPQEVQDILIKLAVVQGRVLDSIGKSPGDLSLQSLDKMLEEEIQQGQMVCARIIQDLRNLKLEQLLLKIKRPAISAAKNLYSPDLNDMCNV